MEFHVVRLLFSRRLRWRFKEESRVFQCGDGPGDVSLPLSDLPASQVPHQARHVHTGAVTYCLYWCVECACLCACVVRVGRRRQSLCRLGPRLHILFGLGVLCSKMDWKFHMIM